MATLAVADEVGLAVSRRGRERPQIEGVIASVEYLRQLDESDLPRCYLQDLLEEFDDVRRSCI